MVRDKISRQFGIITKIARLCHPSSAAEQALCKRQVVGSNPTGGSIYIFVCRDTKVVNWG
jgi:hypothetical protein